MLKRKKAELLRGKNVVGECYKAIEISGNQFDQRHLCAHCYSKKTFTVW